MSITCGWASLTMDSTEGFFSFHRTTIVRGIRQSLVPWNISGSGIKKVYLNEKYLSILSRAKYKLAPVPTFTTGISINLVFTDLDSDQNSKTFIRSSIITLITEESKRLTLTPFNKGFV